jgi:3-dehydroquinate synthase
MQINVNLGPRSYPIVLNRHAFGSFPQQLKKRFPSSKFALVTNTTIARLYGKVISSWGKKLSCEVFAIPDGEKYKTVKTWLSVLDFLLKSGFDRKSVVIALGGGVVGDIAGFAAASFLRGVSYVQVPTTLLAMVDSSVGGKTGVNHKLGKNLIGAFYQPSLVWLDTAFLDTLPRREFVAGYAELFKYAFIGGRAMFEFIHDNNRDLLAGKPPVVVEGIRRSVQIKASVVENDEKETSGLRELLNFGHTFGHAVERVARYRGILHGEAVMLGIKCAIDLGVRTGTVPASGVKRYESLVQSLPAVRLPFAPRAEELYEAMFTDKKVRSGKPAFVLPGKPGSSFVARDVAKEAVIATLRRVLSRP